jgi:hypothetical protein
MEEVRFWFDPRWQFDPRWHLFEAELTPEGKFLGIRSVISARPHQKTPEPEPPAPQSAAAEAERGEPSEKSVSPEPTVTVDQVYDVLGLRPFEEYLKETGKGRTTRKVCEALAYASAGRAAYLLGREGYITEHMTLLARRFAPQLGVGPEKLHVAPQLWWSNRPAIFSGCAGTECLFVDPPSSSSSR